MASSPDNISMAVFCDFENVALGVRDANYEKFDIKPVLERLLLKGSITVKKAYCDWDRYKAFKATMHEANFELIEIPHVRQSGKNSADIRLVVDALDLCYTKSHVNTFVIISGDSDFSPLVSKLRENNKQVIGVGVKQSTSDLLVANCDEFIFYDDLVREVKRAAAKRDERKSAPAPRRAPDEANRRKEELEGRKAQAIEMVVEMFDALVSERGDSGKIWASLLKDTLKRRRPDFNETYFGFRTFGNLLEEAQARGMLEFGRDEKSGAYVYRSSAPPQAAPVNDQLLPLPETEEAPEAEAEEEVSGNVEPRARGGRGGRGGRKQGGREERVVSAERAFHEQEQAREQEHGDEPELEQEVAGQEPVEAVAEEAAQPEARRRGRGGRQRGGREERPAAQGAAGQEQESDAGLDVVELEEPDVRVGWAAKREAVAEDAVVEEAAQPEEAGEAAAQPEGRRRNRGGRKQGGRGERAAADAGAAQAQAAEPVPAPQEPVEVIAQPAPAEPAEAAEAAEPAPKAAKERRKAPRKAAAKALPDGAAQEAASIPAPAELKAAPAEGEPAAEEAPKRRPAARNRRPAKPKAASGG